MDFLPLYLSTRVTLRRRSFICASCNSIVLYVFFFCELQRMSTYWGGGGGSAGMSLILFHKSNYAEGASVGS